MSLFVVFGITLVVFLLVIAGMAVGVLLGRRQLSGSCGGLANQTDAEGNTACSLCSKPDAACKELGRRMEGSLADPAQPAAGDAAGGECEKDCVAEGCSQQAIDACKHR